MSFSSCDLASIVSGELLPERTGVSCQLDPIDPSPEGFLGSSLVSIGHVHDVFQIAGALVLGFFGSGQFGTVLLTVWQESGLKVPLHTADQRIQIARGRFVFDGTRPARCQGQDDQHGQQFQVHFAWLHGNCH